MRKTCLNKIHELARQDPRVVFIGSDLGSGTLEAFKQEFPDRFFMEGVSEQHIIGMAAGLAMEGFIPYINTIATFLTRRCLEQVALDLCLHRLPVRLIGSGGGLVYAPLGPTHQATEDIALMRALPHMTIMVPADAEEMSRLMPLTLTWPEPLYIRLAKGGDPVITRAEQGTTIGTAIELRSGTEVAFVTTGIMTHRAMLAAEMLHQDGISAGVWHFHTLKPLDDASLRTIAQRYRLVVTVEEHSCLGGLGSAVAEWLMDQDLSPLPRLLRFALPDDFAKAYGSQDSLLTSFGLDPSHLVQGVRQKLLQSW